MTIDEAFSKIIPDQETVLTRFSGMKDLMEMYVLKFPTDKTVAAFKNSSQTKDWHQIEVDAHTLKGIAGNLGFDTLFKSSAAVVGAIRSQKFEEAEKHIPEVLKDIDDIISVIQQID